jgi:hypothetical protein
MKSQICGMKSGIGRPAAITQLVVAAGCLLVSSTVLIMRLIHGDLWPVLGWALTIAGWSLSMSFAWRQLRRHTIRLTRPPETDIRQT